MTRAAPLWQRSRCIRKALHCRRRRERRHQRYVARMIVVYNKARSVIRSSERSNTAGRTQRKRLLKKLQKRSSPASTSSRTAAATTYPPVSTPAAAKRTTPHKQRSMRPLFLALILFSCCTFTITPVSAWPAPQDDVASATEIHTYSWLFVPVLGWALGQSALFPDFNIPGNDTTSIFPTVIAQLNLALTAAGINFHTFFFMHPTLGWYASDHAQELMIGLFGNIAGGVLQEYAHSVAEHVMQSQRYGPAMSTNAWTAYETQMRKSSNHTVMLNGLQGSLGYSHMNIPQHVIAAISAGRAYRRTTPLSRPIELPSRPNGAGMQHTTPQFLAIKKLLSYHL